MYFFEWLTYNGRASVDYDELIHETNQQIESNEKKPLQFA